MSLLQMILLALLSASAVLNYIDRQAVSAVSPKIVADFHLSNADWGLVTSVFWGTYVFASWLGGLWMDRVGIRRGLLISTGLWSLAACGHALSSGLASLCSWRVLLAVGEGPGGSALLKGVRRLTPPHLRDTGAGVVGAGNVLGAIVAPLIAIPVAVHYGWRAAFIVTGAVSLLWVPFWALLAARPGANLEAKPLHAAPMRTESPLHLRSAGVWATLLAIFLTVPQTVFTLNFVPLYLNKVHHVSQEALQGLLWQPYAAMGVGQLVGGASVAWLLGRGWSSRSARGAVLALGMLGSMVMIGMVYAPGLGETMAYLNVARFLFQFGYVTLLAYGVEVVAEEQAAAMNGIMNGTLGACGFLLGYPMGWLADHVGYSAVLWMVSILPVAGAAGWLLLARTHERHTERDLPPEVLAEG